MAAPPHMKGRSLPLRLFLVTHAFVDVVREFADAELRDAAGPGHLAQAQVIDQRLVLTRDPLGVAPLYYGRTPDGLLCLRLTADSEERDLADYIETQSRGFGDEGRGATPERIEELRTDIRLGNGVFLVRVGGEAVATGATIAPLDGFTELVGIATLPEHRRRGIAAALTALLADDAFARGAHSAFLTAADEDASRVYQRSGFRLVGTGLAYGDP